MNEVYAISREHKTWKHLIELSSRGDEVGGYGTSRCVYILFSEVINLDAKKVIELGTGGGWSTEAFLLGLEITNGHLWTIDIRPCEATIERLKNYGFDFTFWQGDSLNFIKTWDKGKVEIVYIDTSHTFEQTLKELNAYAPLVKDEGAILLHDILTHNTYQDSYYCVYKAVNEWLKSNPEWQLYIYYTPYGLGKLKRKL